MQTVFSRNTDWIIMPSERRGLPTRFDGLGAIENDDFELIATDIMGT